MDPRFYSYSLNVEMIFHRLVPGYPLKDNCLSATEMVSDNVYPLGAQLRKKIYRTFTYCYVFGQILLLVHCVQRGNYIYMYQRKSDERKKTHSIFGIYRTCVQRRLMLEHAPSPIYNFKAWLMSH